VVHPRTLERLDLRSGWLSQQISPIRSLSGTLTHLECDSGVLSDKQTGLVPRWQVLPTVAINLSGHSLRNCAPCRGRCGFPGELRQTVRGSRRLDASGPRTTPAKPAS